MSQTATAPPRPALPSRPAGPLRRPATPPHVWIFRKLTSMRTALTLLFVLGLLTLAGTLLVQVPAAVKGNHQAYAEWLNTVRPRYGGWTDVLDKLGLFSVFSSVWFDAAVLLLTASVIMCSVRRIPGLWKTATKPRMIMTEAFFERAPHTAQIASGQDQGAALAALGAAFRKNRFHVAVERDGEDVHVCADRFRWSPFGRVAVHVSFIVILLGGILTWTGGFRDEAFTVPIGSRVNVGHGTGVSVEAKSFVDSYYASGPPRNYASRLVLYKGGARITEQDTRVNHPARYDGLTFYQSFFGPAAVMRASAPDGKVIFEPGRRAAVLLAERTGGHRPLRPAAAGPDGLCRLAGLGGKQREHSSRRHPAGSLQAGQQRAGGDPGPRAGQAGDDRRRQVHVRPRRRVHRADRLPRPGRDRRLDRRGAARARPVHGLLLPAPADPGRDPPRGGRHRDRRRGDRAPQCGISGPVRASRQRHKACREPGHATRKRGHPPCLIYPSTASSPASSRWPWR